LLSSLVLSKGIKKYEDQKGVVAVFNTESLYHFCVNENYRKFVISADYICLDGIGVMLLLWSRTKQPRFHGPDLVNELLQSDGQHSYLVIGGGDDLKQSDNVVFQSISHSENRSLLAMESFNIIKSYMDYDFVLISLGLPKQEEVTSLLCQKFSENEALNIKNKLIVPCGAAVDFIFGKKKRAPRIFQILGVEFVYRVFKEPRMVPRILRSVYGLYLAYVRKL